MPAAPADTSNDSGWSSSGLGRAEAIRAWQDWAAQTIAPIDVRVAEAGRFAARWQSRSLGAIRLLHLFAPAQRVVHRGGDSGSGAAAPSLQLVYARRGTLHTRLDGTSFPVRPGEFVLLDNTRFYQMEMESRHEAIDVMMPRGWAERWLPAAETLFARPIDTRTGWGRPLGAFIEAMAAAPDASPLPRAMLADQFGALLALAADPVEPAARRSGGALAARILRLIEAGHLDAEFGPAQVTAALDISARHLQAVLAAQGTSFGKEVAARRLARAQAILAEPRLATLPIGEVAFRCGYLDAGYFARQFRRRYGTAPLAWRRTHASR